MTISKFRDWLEVVGLFSVVLSLVFVGLQMKQSQEIAKAAQYQARFDSVVEVFATRIGDDVGSATLGRLRRPIVLQHLREFSGDSSGFPNYEDMSDMELGRYLMNWAIHFRTYDNIHYQYTNGFLDKAAFDANTRSIEVFSTPEIRMMFALMGNQFREPFRDYVLATWDGLAERQAARNGNLRAH